MQMNSEIMRKMYNSKSQRVDTISGIARMNLPDNWQNVNTPYKIVREMLDLIPESDIYVVFFSMEFLEVMIHEKNIPRDKIVFVADTKVEQTYAACREWYNVKSVLYPKQIVTKDSIVNTLKDVDMKFKKIAVVGNPPYQMQTSKQQAKPIYHLFVEAIIDGINPDNFSMIIPSRWMVGGMGLSNFRDRMMNNPHMKTIKHFPGESEIFDSVLIKGGVNYFLLDKNHSGPCDFNGMIRSLNEYDIILQDNSAVSILEKIRNKTNNWISQKCSVIRPFGIVSNFYDWDSSGTICYSTRMAKNFIHSSKFTDKNDLLKKWKVCTSKGINPNDNGCFEKYNSLFIAEPNSICTETYLVVNSFDSEIEAKNFVSYMKTIFFRFFVSLRVLTQNMSMESFSWVPDMEDYTKKYTDEYLYKKFSLNEEEIAYIESKIKEI